MKSNSLSQRIPFLLGVGRAGGRGEGEGEGREVQVGKEGVDSGHQGCQIKVFFLKGIFSKNEKVIYRSEFIIISIYIIIYFNESSYSL